MQGCLRLLLLFFLSEAVCNFLEELITVEQCLGELVLRFRVIAETNQQDSLSYVVKTSKNREPKLDICGLFLHPYICLLFLSIDVFICNRCRFIKLYWRLLFFDGSQKRVGAKSICFQPSSSTGLNVVNNSSYILFTVPGDHLARN